MTGSFKMLAVDATGAILAKATRVGPLRTVDSDGCVMCEQGGWEVVISGRARREPLRTLTQVSALRAVRGVPGVVDIVHVRDSRESPPGPGTACR